MNNFARAHDSYLNPPDDDPICEDGCGETMSRDIDGTWFCANQYCPLKYDKGTMARAMAEKLVDAQDEIDNLKIKIKRLEQR